MSQSLINEYLRQLDVIKKISGSSRETIVREAFKDLLKSWGKQEDLVFIAEYPAKTAARTNIVLDGALLHELRMPLGYWEAKDEKDDLDEEIDKKLRKGYPQDNIIFSDDVHAVLIQHGEEVHRCEVSDTRAVQQLLEAFFKYERHEIADFRRAVEQFKVDLPAVLEALRQLIDKQYAGNPEFKRAASRFLDHAREAINPSIGDADVREMLIQHVLTEEIFSKVFDSEFHHENNVAKELYALENVFFTGALKKKTLKGLEPYYAAIRSAAAQISNHGEKQTFLKVIYENFYRVYNTKAADRLGVVYTPNEIVRFMVAGADWLCEKNFRKNLIDKDVDILDPATGTGTFVCELLEFFRGQKAKLKQKYLQELHANEVAILPYYVANLNIEATYAALTDDYQEFPSLCFVDTLDNVGVHTAVRGTTAELFGSVSQENVARIKRQNLRKISVVIGNPPYNANQANENDNNKNREYPAVDERVRKTYVAESTAQKTKVYDMYARFFRWATDRLPENGILAFITNRSFIDGRTFDGFRKVVAEEFTDIYVVDLGGDVRADPRLSGTKHNVFGIQTGVAISFFVKKAVTAKEKRRARIHYVARPQLETADDKLTFLSSHHLRDVEFEVVTPSDDGHWINQADTDFDDLLPLATKETKAAKSPTRERAIFKLFTNGVNTARDEWVYDLDRRNLRRKMDYMIEVYNKEHARAKRRGEVDFDKVDKSIKWSAGLIGNLPRTAADPFSRSNIVDCAYRPFFVQSYYADPIFSDRLTGNHYECFGAKLKADWPCFALTAPGSSKSFSALAVVGLADWHFLGDTQLYPFKRTADGVVADNITDWALNKFRAKYPAGKSGKKRALTKEDVFFYCYGVLNDPVYRSTYALNLKRDFPRIPFYVDFWTWRDFGAELISMHANFATTKPWPLKRVEQEDEKSRSAGKGPKAILRANVSAGSIRVDSETELTGIPSDAWDYQFGGRSALGWVLDQYRESVPRDATVAERFNTYRFDDHKEEVIELLCRITTVSVETMKVIARMSAARR